MDGPFDPAGADAAKAEGMARVHRGANPVWMMQMQAYAIMTAREMQQFTSDDVFERAYLFGLVAGTGDRRAFGPVMMGLARSGVCCKADRPPVNSQRVSLHASPRTVWDSKIYNTPSREWDWCWKDEDDE